MKKGVCIECQLELVLSYFAELWITVLCSGAELMVWGNSCAGVKFISRHEWALQALYTELAKYVWLYSYPLEIMSCI